MGISYREELLLGNVLMFAGNRLLMVSFDMKSAHWSTRKLLFPGMSCKV
jgi:hypothetical protein